MGQTVNMNNYDAKGKWHQYQGAQRVWRTVEYTASPKQAADTQH